MNKNCPITIKFLAYLLLITFGDLTLLVGWEEGRPACSQARFNNWQRANSMVHLETVH